METFEEAEEEAAAVVGDLAEAMVAKSFGVTQKLIEDTVEDAVEGDQGGSPRNKSNKSLSPSEMPRSR